MIYVLMFFATDAQIFTNVFNKQLMSSISLKVIDDHYQQNIRVHSCIRGTKTFCHGCTNIHECFFSKILMSSSRLNVIGEHYQQIIRVNSCIRGTKKLDR